MVAPLCDAENLVLVRRNGDLARVGFMDERPVAVTRRAAIEQVFAESLTDGVLAIAGRRSGPIPEAGVIADWASQQQSIHTDAAFQRMFTVQLTRLGEALTQIAAQRHCDPLALELPDLCAWAIEQADRRLER